VKKNKSWRELWVRGETPWDIGAPHPGINRCLEIAAELCAITSGTAWVPGCGRGHEARELARRGFQTMGSDIAPEAIAAARALGEEGLLTFEVADALSSSLGRYDLVFDRAMLCALHPQMRQQYMQRVKESLKPGGLFIGILFSNVVNDHGPPFAVDEYQAHSLLGEEGSLVALEAFMEKSSLSFVMSEYLFVWQQGSIDGA
tara:strand:+ start:1225 stop:1830 length:606 start_codon:yes stop_codon:yes gene_type:complete